ncbi:hypothetical protein SteCoe_5312 [Stentor coeruleus]|uniref:F-box domain-containing protein n=1 Tax=Stentor coeruleus TaxID=5963 RepID=A0A1R2CSN7_9CILI|nr:hypothetical protein SteCoe_5312 [Stentor coeruleus]
MNSPIIIQIIASFLDVETMITFSEVCKLFHKTAQIDSFWEKFYNMKYVGSLEIFGELVIGDLYMKPLNRPRKFLKLYQKGALREKNWSAIKGRFLPDSDIGVISMEIRENLKNPLLPLPMLRREAKNFSTLVQDLLGNAFEEPPLGGFNSFSEAETLMQILYDIQESLIQEYSTNCHSSILCKTRWQLKSKNSYIKKYTKGISKHKSIIQSKSFFVNDMILVIKGLIKTHCTSVLVKLEKISEIKTFLSEYCIRWEAYSASLSSLETILSPLCSIFNTIYDCYFPHKFRTPTFTICRLMIIIWKREVFNYVYETIINGIVIALQKVRENLEKNEYVNMDYLENDILMISKTVQFIVDMSGNELTFQYIDHTEFPAEKKYLMLEQKIERATQQYYIEISTLPLCTCKKLMKYDELFVSRIFLQRTSYKIKKMRLETLLQSYQSHYFSLYKEYGSFFNDELPTDPFMYTAFGKMLFNNDSSLTSTKKIKNFIEYIKVKSHTNDIVEYNNIDGELEEIKKGLCDKNEEIEYINEGQGFSLEIPKEESMFFSLADDIDVEDFEKVAKYGFK